MIILNENLATRVSAQSLFERMRKENDYTLDFKNVIIASRSFTNEFVNLEKKTQNKSTKEEYEKRHKIYV